MVVMVVPTNDRSTVLYRRRKRSAFAIFLRQNLETFPNELEKAAGVCARRSAREMHLTELFGHLVAC